jgi:4-amino-4-deoxy-L-arabinose transferase-like glycosyltransferase
MFWLGMAGGFLTKGAIGVAVPAAVAGAFLAALLAARRLGLTSVKVWRDVGWLWGPLLFAAPIAAWVYAVRQAGGAELASEVFRQSFTRFASKSADHAAPVWFYGDIVLYKTLPLAILLLTWLVLRRRRGSARVQGSTAFDPDVLFPIVWFVVVFAGLSVAAAKRALYLSPLLPAAGLLSAVLWTSIAPRLPIAAYVATAWVVAPLAFVVGRAATIRQYGAKDVDFAEVFEALDVNEAKPPFILYTPTEGLEGAHVYFTGRTAPVAHTPEELEQLVRADPKTLVFFEWRHSWKPAAPIVGGLTIRVLHEYEVGRNRVIVAEVKP